MTDWLAQLDRDGYAWLPGVFGPGEVAAARAAVAAAVDRGAADPAVLAAAGGPAAGARDLLRLWPGAADLARAPGLAGPLVRVLGANAGVVRGLYFDKPPGHGWALPWHRDKTVALKAHRPAGGFGKPTTKAGVPHAEAPADVLAGMLTARVHLDPMTAANGPLRVVPGSHAPAALGRADGGGAVALSCAAGDVLLIRPLVLHSSGHPVPGHPGRRRVVHLELAPAPDLPGGSEWHEFVPVGRP